MAKLILVSVEVVWNKSGKLFPEIEKTFADLRKAGHYIFLVSNHKKPPLFAEIEKFAVFQACVARQNGKIVTDLLQANPGKLKSSDVIVLGATETDFLMAVNSQSVLFCSNWAQAVSDKTQKYGVPLTEPQKLVEAINLLEDKHPWYFEFTSDFLDISALTDAGTKYETDLQLQRLATRLQLCLKDGQPALKSGFLLHILSSLYRTDKFKTADIWSYYPSSSSTNGGQEIMTAFCDIARITFKRRTKGPLFIRHKPSIKRHLSSANRDDPTSQLESVHLNPAYKDTIAGKTVVVMDDYLTRGVSFGVSAALLQSARAKKVIGVAMGKFGKGGSLYNIEIRDNVFAPIKNFKINPSTPLSGVYHADAKLQFLMKFRHKL